VPSSLLIKRADGRCKHRLCKDTRVSERIKYAHFRFECSFLQYPVLPREDAFRRKSPSIASETLKFSISSRRRCMYKRFNSVFSSSILSKHTTCFGMLSVKRKDLQVFFRAPSRFFSDLLFRFCHIFLELSRLSFRSVWMLYIFTVNFNIPIERKFSPRSTVIILLNGDKQEEISPTRPI